MSTNDDSTSTNGGFNLPDLRAFFDLEKLAQDLSEVGVVLEFIGLFYDFS